MKQWGSSSVYRGQILSGASFNDTPDSKVHGANMGPIWGRQDPGGPHVGPMNFAMWDNYTIIGFTVSLVTTRAQFTNMA